MDSPLDRSTPFLFKLICMLTNSPVAITYLHHTHPTVAHYASATWSFKKGALGTVDRSFGPIGRHFFHDIIDHHVIHHLFPKIPFYRAEEATAWGSLHRTERGKFPVLALEHVSRLPLRYGRCGI